MYFLRRHAPWISSAILGALLVAGGIYMVVQGLAVRNEIRDELRAEQITTSQDTSIPGVLVDDAETARAQADTIKQHTLEAARALRSGDFAVNDLLERFAQDRRIGLQIGDLRAILQADDRFVGGALEQADGFVAAVAELCRRVPEAVTYEPGPLL